MGLAAPRKRAKLSHDPNNTRWARSTSAYGRRQLLAQGWEPGQLLGRQDAAYAAHLSAASAAHVRVALREEGVGLGAELGAAGDACTGLGGLQDLLSRLNGKDAGAIRREAEARDALKLKRVVQARYGRAWVRGGFLGGTESMEVATAPESRREVDEGGLERPAGAAAVVKPTIEGTDPSKKRRKKRRKESEHRTGHPSLDSVHETTSVAAAISATSDEAAYVESAKPVEGTLSNPLKTKKRRKKRNRDPADSTAEAVPSTFANPVVGAEPSGTGIILNPLEPTEAAARPDKKRKKKKAAAARAPARPDTEAVARVRGGVSAAEHAAMPDGVTRVGRPAADVGTWPAASPAPSTRGPIADGRNAVRRRYIQQKRLAMDPKALNEILMVKG